MTLTSQIFLAILPLIVTYSANWYRNVDRTRVFPQYPPTVPTAAETFDFIIVGAGAAGSVLANRLSEKFHVLLIEAGGEPPVTQTIPYVNYATEALPEINFDFMSTKQPNVNLAGGGICPQTQGKMLGGSTSHNEMIWERGNPKDYDTWASITADSSWKYDNVEQYFRKTERFYLGRRVANDDERGYDGKMNIALDTFKPGANLWLEAGKELKYDIVDSNQPQKTNGFRLIDFAKKNGRRESAYTAYLKPILNRKTLHVYQYSLVSKVIFENKRAVGVEFKRHNISMKAYASKEVILSAGSIVTPMILIKSGIGPEDQIRIANVPTVSNLPVGKGIKNHPRVILPPFYINPQYSWNIDANLLFLDVLNFVFIGRGPLSGSSYATAEVFYPSTRAAPENWPDLQVMYMFNGPEPNSVTCQIASTRLKSAGTLTLNSSATSMEDVNLPIIDLNYYTADGDYDATIDGIEFCLKVLGTNTFKKQNIKMSTVKLDACKEFQLPSREYWKCYLRQKTISQRHLHSSCRMGSGPADEKAVVDSKLNVIGVTGLRVVDQSVIPNLNANTMAATLMIAEKAADMILQLYPNN